MTDYHEKTTTRRKRPCPRPRGDYGSTRWWTLVPIILLVSFSTRLGGVSAKLFLRQKASSVASLMVCRITVEDTTYARGVADWYSEEQTVCIPIIDEIEDTETYAIQLPDHIERTYKTEIKRGKLHLLIFGAKIVGNAIVTAPTSTFSVIQEYNGSRGRNLQEQADRYTKALGRKRYAIVRISTTDSTPSIALDAMVKRFAHFKDGMEAQYRDCSQNQLLFYLTGAYDVKLHGSMDTYQANPRNLREGAMEKIKRDYNISTFPDDVADYVLFVIPPGTGSWVANAATGHFRSQYNDAWGISLSAVMVRASTRCLRNLQLFCHMHTPHCSFSLYSQHEIGHNFGLGHSNERGEAYGDISGFMGSVLPSETKPKKCFNAAHHDYLGWYSSQKVVLSPLVQSGTRIKVAAFVDASKAQAHEPVILSLDDSYLMQFNRAKRFNKDTEEYGNMLVMTQYFEGSTEVLAALDVGNDFLIDNYRETGQSVRVKVCEFFQGGVFTADFLVVGVGQSADPCNFDLFESPNPPTFQPSHFPTRSPTSLSTASPEREPTTFPTNAPPSFSSSISPPVIHSTLSSPGPTDSGLLSSYPSIEPSVVSSQSPTASSSRTLSSDPSQFPTGYPSQRPSGWPSMPPSSDSPSMDPTSTMPSSDSSGFPSSPPSESPSNSPTDAATYSTSPSLIPSSSTTRSVAPSEAPSFSHQPSKTTSNSSSLVPSTSFSPTPASEPTEPKKTSTQNWQFMTIFRRHDP